MNIADDIFKYIFNESVLVSITISLKLVTKFHLIISQH